MKKVAILVPRTAIIEAVADPHYIFNAVNQFLQLSGKEPLFDIKLVGLEKEVKLNGSLFTVHTDYLIGEMNHADLIIIPAISGNLAQAIELNKDFFPWIVNQHKYGAEVASLCIGAFLLASTGLLEGKKCST